MRSGEGERDALAERRRIALARDMGDGKVRARLALDDLQPDELPRRFEFAVGRKALEAELARVGAAIDLPIEQNVAGFDAQTIGGVEAALAQTVFAAGVEEGLPQALAFGARHQQFVAELAAIAEPGDQHGAQRGETEITQRAHELRTDEARHDARACRALQRGDGVFAGAIARDAVQPFGITAPAGEEPPALASEPPCGGVVEDAAVVVEEQRVGDLAGFEMLEVATLHAANAGKLVVPHEGEVEQPRRTASGEVLFASAHSERQSSRPPLMTHSAPARRRRTSALATCASRTPITRPASSKTVTRAATRKSMKPWPRLPIEPEVAAMICSTWLVATAASGA